MGSIKMVEQEDRCTIENSEQALLIERKKINDGKTHKKKLCLGIVLALASNVLGTSNNFIIKSFNVVVADAVLVICNRNCTIFFHYLDHREIDVSGFKKTF